MRYIEKLLDRGNVQIHDQEGRVYYDNLAKWQDAYEMYTEEESPVLNVAEQKHLIDIMNQKVYNRKLLVAGAIWIVIFGIFLVVDPTGTVFQAPTPVKWISYFAQLAILIWSVYKFNSRPYNLLYWLLPGMFAFAALYIFIWLR